MKKKSASYTAFFTPRLLIGFCLVLAGVVLALVGFGTASSAQAQQKRKIVDIPGLPPGFDCSKIHELGIDRQENLRAGRIMIACGEAEGGSAPGKLTSSNSVVSKLIENLMPSPLFIGGVDVDVILPDGTYPHVTQSESMEWCGANNTCVVNYNDSRANGGSTCYGGISYSTDGGATWHASQQLCTGHGTNYGDPIVVYNTHLGLWFAGDLVTGCGGFGIGLWTSPDGVTWTPGSCVHNGSNDDRESFWVDNNPSSPHYGRMYVSWNDYTTSCGVGGCLFVNYSDDGVTWTHVGPLNSGTFLRDIQITGDLQGSGRVYLATMDEGGGGLANRQNGMYRSTDGGATWAFTNVGPPCQGPGRSTSGYFALAFSSIWRHMGWGEPAANGNVVSLDYACCGQNVACSGASDHGDIYYNRSTDAGITWGTPVKLNTDAGTAMQWQPSLTATASGALFASWYDQREVNGGADLNCTVGSASQPCYRRWGRVSLDNGATWQPDDQVGRALSPLPAQPDGSVQSTYEGDYDYHSSLGTMTIGGWTDGRNIISNTSQQDVFVNRVQAGFGVTSSNPACNSLINTQPVDFVINLSEAVQTGTVQASNFTVNGTPSNLPPTFSNGNATITFHFSSTPVTTPGPQTMHIPAGAFIGVDNMPVSDFTCSFCYDTAQLMVTSTNPPVGGTFSPQAPGDYTYDVNFNEAVDAGSVSTSDLTVTGNVGGSVTNVTLINGNTTAQFTVHFNFGGSVTLSIAAGAITAHTCNGNAAFSGNYTVEGCPPPDYVVTTGTGTIVTGTIDTGNHCDDCATLVTLPFPVSLYGISYTQAYVESDGNFQFTTSNGIYSNTCLPADPSQFGPTIFPDWYDQNTACSGTGIYYTVTGTAPNRVLYYEYRDGDYPTCTLRDYELVFYENNPGTFSVIYSNTNGGNPGTVGVQSAGGTMHSE